MVTRLLGDNFRASVRFLQGYRFAYFFLALALALALACSRAVGADETEVAVHPLSLPRAIPCSMKFESPPSSASGLKASAIPRVSGFPCTCAFKSRKRSSRRVAGSVPLPMACFLGARTWLETVCTQTWSCAG